jgi:branched-chain amino acid transport system permease protein
LIFSDIFNNWISLTNGPMGIAGIPRPTILKLTLSSQVNFAALGFLLAAFGYFIVKKIVNSSFGMVLRAIREDEIATLTLGKNVHKFKVAVFMISAAIAGVAGSLFAYYFSFIDPSSFGIEESIFILVLVILGGTASLNGSLLGVAVLLIVPEAFRFANLPDPIQANMRQIFYGLLLIIFMRLRPQGLIGEFDFKR